jgi:Raf kinase inhibitor-like YbhB/YbcL family protein
VSFGCSSSTSAPSDASGGGGHGGAGGGDAGGADAAAGTDAAAGDGAVVDAPDGSVVDGPNGDGDGGDAASPDGFAADAISPDVVPTDSAMSVALTSTALAEGAAFSSVNTCAGANTSPPLSWTAGPAGTMSYAVVLTDLSIDAVHWVIWDIPAATTSLPAALPGDGTLTAPAGAKQVHKLEFFGAGGAYRGPCPSGKTHIYQLEVNAIASATLAGVTTTSSVEAVKAAVQAASVAHGDLDGTSNATAPPADAGGQ